MSGRAVPGGARLLPAVTCALFAGVVIALSAAADPSQLSATYREWGEGPARWLMTAAEHDAWQRLASDQDAEQFIRLFWARRDPTPDSELNETRRDFEQRAAYADHQFGTEDVRGAMTDRGRVLILLGPPKRVQRPGAGGSSTGGDVGASDNPFDTSGSVSTGAGPGRFGTGGGTDRAGVASEERWVYEDERVPAFVDRRRFQVRFLSKPGTDQIELTQASDVMGFLLEARQSAISRPELTVADLEAALPAAPADGAGILAYRGEALGGEEVAALERAVADGEAPSIDAGLTAAAFQASDGRWIVPVQVAVTGAAPTDPGRLLGELIDSRGTSRLAFRLEQPWQESRDQRYVKDTLVVPEPGEYRLRAGLEGDDGRIVWSASETVSVPEPTEGLWLSELIVSDHVFPLQEAQEMLEPWAWQGIVVVPKADATFPQGGLMWLYLHACNPQLGESAQPQLRVTAAIEGPSRFRAPMSVQPARAGDHCWVVASGIDLVAERFPPGSYEVELQVRDSIAGETLSSGGEFIVTGP